MSRTVIDLDDDLLADVAAPGARRRRRPSTRRCGRCWSTGAGRWP